jgi:phosphoribosylamine--glycine ligase
MINKTVRKFETASGFCVGIVVTTPPFPYSRHRVPVPVGLPVLVEGQLTAAERRHLHYGEVGLKDGRLVTTGAYGSTLVVTGEGATIEEARDAANRLAAKVDVINARYRRDIGQRLIDGNFAEIRALGLFA